MFQKGIKSSLTREKLTRTSYCAKLLVHGLFDRKPQGIVALPLACVFLRRRGRLSSPTQGRAITEWDAGDTSA
jgi:hypothetical protein